MTATQPIATRRRSRIPDLLRRYPTLTAAAVCVVSFTGFWLAQRAAHVSMIDLMVYRVEGWTARTGGDLYEMRATANRLPNTYPPFAAMLFIPLTWLGVGVMRTAATAGNLGLMVLLAHLSLRLLGRPPRLPAPAAALLLAAAAVWCEPVWTTLRYGQVNVLLAVLVLWDFTRRAGHRWAGVGTGIAAGVKLTPALFVVFLTLAGAAVAWRRLRRGDRPGNRYLRQAAVAGLAFLATVGLAALVLPRDSRRFWTETLFAANRPGFGEDTANQSLRGVLARALHTGDPGHAWLPVAAVAACAGLAVAVAALAAGRRLPYGRAWAVTACAVTALLVSPVSWSHHWVWSVPMVLLLGAEALRRRRAVWTAGAVLAWLVFCSFALWTVPHGNGRFELSQGPGQMLLSAVYPLTGAVYLAVAGTLAVRALRGRTEAARPPGALARPAYEYAGG